MIFNSNVFERLKEEFPNLPDRCRDVAPFTRAPEYMHDPKLGEKSPGEKLIHIARLWKAQRKEYPGWIILPLKNREKLYRTTKEFINTFGYLLEGEKDASLHLSPPHDILVLFEFVWRLDKVYLPIKSNGKNPLKRSFNNTTPSPSKSRIPMQCSIRIARSIPTGTGRQLESPG